jgi:vacuole morphology and inheritance protein 14
LDLQILATISSSSQLLPKNKITKDGNNKGDKESTSLSKYNSYFTKFMTELLDLFRRDTNLRYEKSSVIIRQLCVLLNPEDIFRMFAEILINEKDTEFAIVMVDILNTILLTSSELFELRNQLKDFNTPVIIFYIFFSFLL